MTIAAPQPVLDRSLRPSTGDRVVLRAEGLRKSFGGQQVLDGVDLELREGEVVLLRGENGSGKTTLLNILTGNLEPDAGEIHYLADSSPRAYRFPRRWWQELNPFDHFTPEFVAREGMGRTWQDVRLFGSQTLRDNIAVADSRNPGENPMIALFAPGHARRRESGINQQADDMLTRLGLAGRESSSADKISLGQSKRVAIARAVAAGARILFLDEPLAGLDHHGIRDILDLLETLVKNHRLTLVVVEHVFNFAHLHHLVNVHWSLAEGRITREDATSIPQEDFIDGIPVVTHPHWFHLFSQGADVMPPEHLPRRAVLTRFRLHGRYEPKPVFKLEDLVVKRGHRTVIGADADGKEVGFNLTLHRGEIAVLQAPNGWGKSTLFEAITGIIPCASGTVHLGETDISDMPDWQRPRTGLHLNAAGSPYFKDLRLTEIAELSGHALNGDTPVAASRLMSSLSGGQSRRISLSSFLRRDNLRVALLDEPFLAFDQAAIFEFVERIQTLPFEAMLIAEPHRF